MLLPPTAMAAACNKKPSPLIEPAAPPAPPAAAPPPPAAPPTEPPSPPAPPTPIEPEPPADELPAAPLAPPGPPAPPLPLAPPFAPLPQPEAMAQIERVENTATVANRRTGTPLKMRLNQNWSSKIVRDAQADGAHEGQRVALPDDAGAHAEVEADRVAVQLVLEVNVAGQLTELRGDVGQRQIVGRRQAHGAAVEQGLHDRPRADE